MSERLGTVSGTKIEAPLAEIDSGVFATSLTISGQPVATGTGGGGVSDHGSLTGLGDDDHTQYSLADGTRDFSSTVGGVAPVASSDLSTKNYVDTQDVSISGHLQNGISTLDLQDAYDNGDGVVIATAGKPFVVSGTEYDADIDFKVVGSGIFTEFLQVGSGTVTSGTRTTFIAPSGITTGILAASRGVNFDQVVAPPDQMVITLVDGAGNVNNGEHFYQVTYYSDVGETEQDSGANSVTTVTASGKVDITSIPISSDPRAIGRRLYRTPRNDEQSENSKLLVQIADNTTTVYQDNINDSSLIGQNAFFRNNTTSSQLTLGGAPLLFDGRHLLAVGRNAGAAALAVDPAVAESTTYIGTNAGASDDEGYQNTYIGSNASPSSVGARESTIIGANASFSDTGADLNTVVGAEAFYNNKTGSTNTIMGNWAARGSANTTNPASNTIIGAEAGLDIEDGRGNSFLGYKTGSAITTGDYNTVIGAYAGYLLTSGSRNVFLGYYAGRRQVGIDDAIIIDNRQRSSAAAEITDAWIYGQTSATIADQFINLNGQVKMLHYDTKLWLGASEESSLTYDGTNMIIKPDETGGGYLHLDGDVGVSGTIDIDGNVTFNAPTHTIAGIQNQNLTDKSDSETITGAWDFSNSLTISGAAAFAGTHADLDGLSEDDHTQYSLVDGSRAFTNPVAGVDPVGAQDLLTYTVFLTEGAAISGSLQSQIDTNTAGIATNASQIVSVSGHLQSEIDAVGAVESINSLTGAVTITGSTQFPIITEGQTITVSGQDYITNLTEAYDGSILDSPGYLVSSDGATITFHLSNSDASTISHVQISGTTIEHTVPDTVALTAAGTDTNPQENWIFLQENAGTLTLTSNTSGFPAAPHARVARAIVQTASGVAASGVLKLHAYTDHVFEPVSRGSVGHIHAISERIREQWAQWASGVALTTTVDTGPTPDEVTVQTTAGVVLQLHTHVFPALDTDAGDLIFIFNDFTTPYKTVTSLSELTEYNDGSSVGGSERFNVVIWGVVSENDEDCKLFLNLPISGYNNDSNASEDVENTAVYAIPQSYSGTAFLISRLTLKRSGAGGNTWTVINNLDLRGATPGTFPGGTVVGGGGVSDHSLLTNLTNDDHPQYPLSDGSRGFSATVSGVDPVDSDDLSTKGYVDTADSTLQTNIDGKVAIAGDTMTGALGILGAVVGDDALRVVGSGTITGDAAVSGTMTVGEGGVGDAVINWKADDVLTYIEGVDDSDSDQYKIAGSAGFGNDDLLRLDTAGNLFATGTVSGSCWIGCHRPRRISQDTAVASGTGGDQINAGELAIWHRPSSSAVFMIYNDPVEGVVSGTLS